MFLNFTQQKWRAIFYIMVFLVESMRLTNEGFPNRKALENITADYVLNCSVCNLPIVKLEKKIDALIISSPLRRYAIETNLFINADKILKDLKNNKLGELDKILRENYNGLDFYCRECNKVYCEKHYLLWPIWEDSGWYDYTLGTCPKGHERVVDD